MRLVLAVLLCVSLALSGEYARYAFWPTLAQGQPVYRELGGQVQEPLVVGRAEAAWRARVQAGWPRAVI